MIHISTSSLFLTKKIAVLALSSLGIASIAQAYSYDFEGLTTDGSSINGNGNANASGWYGSNYVSSAYGVSASTENSPWSAGSGSLLQSFDSTVTPPSGVFKPSPYLYFTDHTGTTTGSPSTSVTGALGASMTGSGYSMSWDFKTTNVESQPVFVLADSSGTEVITLDVRQASSNVLRYYDGATEMLDDTPILDDTWYRFEIIDIDVLNDTYGFNVYEWNGTGGTVIASASDLDFRSDVSDLDMFRMKVNSNATTEYYLDNVSIIPEIRSFSMLLGLSACLSVVVLKRRRS
ncbi:hypothetical protein QEH59_00590 [Coraliomargarita sp. SDUM461004]|uniref:PEP-CTERM sorting domain-containing protein n=1 Tax=Thalassobacterium sedimentorum TaxID=3041258 RepID=A0ABU1ADX3_9BACT|nr:hypothetical protein [Coraliomargarita sp. SDUM461004]MDQ8192901.1 hypothetical protein [Coraliomargarita sp. SDUM461004]